MPCRQPTEWDTESENDSERARVHTVHIRHNNKCCAFMSIKTSTTAHFLLECVRVRSLLLDPSGVGTTQIINTHKIIHIQLQQCKLIFIQHMCGCECVRFFVAIISFFTMTFLDAIEITSDGSMFVWGAFYFNTVFLVARIERGNFAVLTIKNDNTLDARCRWKRRKWKGKCAAQEFRFGKRSIDGDREWVKMKKKK